jgi:hypothetical protein
MSSQTISIGIFKNEDEGYRVECVAHGFVDESQANAAANYIASLLCGDEIQVADQQTKAPTGGEAE